MKNRQLHEINAGSMADIAFLLLIFFIVSTTIEVDKGIPRKLPPAADPENIPTNRRNTMVVLVNRNDELFVQQARMDISGLKKAAMDFIDNPNNDIHLPEKTNVYIPRIGEIPVTRNHIISLQNDRGTSYSAYIAVQNELTAAYNELRNNLALKLFKKPYAELDDTRKDAIEKVYPLRISEMNPVDILADY